MKFFIALLITCFFCNTVSAQLAYYAAAKSGLSIREQPDVNAKVIDKIPYGQKFDLLKDTAEMKAISVEGFAGNWWLINYHNKKGYVVSSYTLPLAPPGTGIKKLEEYFAQVSETNGSAVVISEFMPAGEDSGNQLKKQLYKNGMEWHGTQGHEYDAALYILPGYTIEQAFLLLRLLGQYPELIAAQDIFPAKNIKSKNGMGARSIEVEREKYDDGKQGPIKKIKITHTAGVVTEFEIFTIDTQVLISYSSGV